MNLNFRHLKWAALLLLFLFSGTLLVNAQPVQTENAEVELISENLTIQPGESFWIGVRMDLRDGWYVYYRNPGDSGMPLMTEWMHDKDFNIGEIQWPYPLWIEVGAGLASYGYYGDVLLMMEATAPDDLEPGTEYTLKAEADYLICEKICIPEYVDIELTLGITDDDVEYNEEWLPYFAETRAKHPVELNYWKADASVSDDGNEITLELTTDAFELPEYSEIIYFANEEGEIENASKPEFSQDGQVITITMQKSGYKSDDVTRVWGLVYNADGWDDSGDIKAITVDVDLTDEAVASVGDTDSTLSVFTLRFLIILSFAFLGGLILNLMPCVFPILSIKVMNFMQMSGHNPGEVKKHGFIFGAGVLLSFLVLAGLLLLLRAGGQELGWGFQLQTPAFIAFMTFLMFGLGLSLMGVFEIGSSLINVAGKAGTGEGLRGSFFSGILATVLATPCTAPFMGTALGIAITLPATTALMIFAMLGIGMAAPYILLSSFPALMKFLPKPGPWMETFKQAMAFPLFATAIWLIWVFGQQAGVDGLTNLLIGLLFLSLGIWIIHRWNRHQISTRSRIITRSIATVLIVGGFLFSASSEAVTFDGSETASVDSYGIAWEPFSHKLVDQYRDEGRNIFIDFTAAWCITCKANERVIFSSNRVKDRFEELDFVMVKADWTNRNPEITRALASFGRNGVPLYVIYSEDFDEPKILPEILTPGIVMDALKDISSGEVLTLGE